MTAPVHSSFTTTDPEQAQAVIADAYADNHLRISGDPSDFHFQHERWAAGLMWVDETATTLNLKLDLQPLDALWICDVRRSALEIEVDRVTRQYRGGDAFLTAPPGVEFHLDGYADRNVGLDPHVFAEVTGDEAFDPMSRLRLDPLPPQAAAAWRRTVDLSRTTCSAIPRRRPTRSSSAVPSGSSPRSCSTATASSPPRCDATRRPPRSAAPSPSSRAPRTSASASPASPAPHTSRSRGLQLPFRRHLGTTPLRYLRRVRLDLARSDLQSADPGDGATVTDIAMRWGYADLGRFAVDYRAAFGEQPHRTLRRAPEPDDSHGSPGTSGG